MDGKIKDFTDLYAWKAGHKVVLFTYKLTNTFPRTEIFGLTSQMQRAAVSITSNIAEGFGRRSYKEKALFFYTSNGSLTELKNQYIISRDIGYISNSQYKEASVLIDTAHKLIQGLIKKSKTLS